MHHERTLREVADEIHSLTGFRQTPEQSKWQDRMDRSQPTARRGNSMRAQAGSGPDRDESTMNRNISRQGGQQRRAQGGGKQGSSGGGGIDSMKSDFHPRLHRAGSAIEQAIAELKAAAADVDDSPSAQPVKDMMTAVADQLQRPLDQIGEVGSVSRQADAPYWDLAEGNRPNKQAWTKD